MTCAKFAFGLICVLVCGYAIVSQISRYLENNDTSTIGFKPFLRSPQDKYPTFTICLHGRDGDGEMYSYFEDDLYNTFGLQSKEYEMLLKGVEVKDTNNTRAMDIQNISSISHEQFTLKLQEFLSGLEFETTNSNDSFSYVNGTEARLQFYIGHQDPETICFTRKSEVGSASPRKLDQIYLVLEKLMEFGDFLRFNIYVHQPGQLMRTFDKPIFDEAIINVVYGLGGNQLSFAISQTNVLRKRADANDPCDADLQDEDMKIKMEIMKSTGCVPPYWSSIMPNDSTITACKTLSQLADIYSGIRRYKDVMISYEPPCDHMKFTVVVQKQDFSNARLLLIQFTYMDETYQEIRNVRDFGWGSFWSNVGGFIGMLLGYSLLQVPDIMSMISAWFQERNNNIRRVFN